MPFMTSESPRIQIQTQGSTIKIAGGQVKHQVGLVNAGTFMKSLLQQLLQRKAAGTPVLNWIKRIPWLCAIYV